MTIGQEFDYIIIGAGSAGCVLAARLSQDPSTRVALVEAGGPDDAPEIKKPIAFPQLFKTRYDWDFASEPEPGLGERRIYLPRGKTLGGSSAMNAIIYIRGNVADFDGWADKEGGRGGRTGRCCPTSSGQSAMSGVTRVITDTRGLWLCRTAGPCIPLWIS
jgi:choline dehydrogenase-like flavoprotein